MKNRYNQFLGLLLICLLALPFNSQAGNEQRVGEAGASYLLINPWAAGSGWGGANTAFARGHEASFLNVAGTAHLNKTELLFTHTVLFKGADISLNAFGFSQKMGESGVLSLSVNSFDYGEIPITTVDLPEGNIGTFHPTASVIALSYAKEFSNSIFGGITVKIISEALADVAASGVAFDAGIQYVTGNDEQIHFGIAMKNVGPTMKFQGDGLSFRGVVPETEVDLTVLQRSAQFEMPSLITIGAAYDFLMANDSRFTLALNFTSNSFTKDQFNLGGEFMLRNILFLRAGYIYEKGINPFDLNFSTRETAFTGPSFGASVQIPLNKENGTYFSLDYSYRDTNPFTGVHSIGARITL
jgi:hypothetical protein